MPVRRLQRALGPLLHPLGMAYGALMAAHRQHHETAVGRFRPPCPCVSVGNIAWGGTGKTPLVDWLLGWAETRSLTAAVLTRGYGAKPSALPFEVHDLCTSEEAGDEPLMLCVAHPKAHILVDPVRRRAGAFAVERFKPDIIVLDDGMQHLAVERDLDLVVLRPEDVLAEWNRVIPAGQWREGAGALARAGAFLIKAAPDAFEELKPQLIARLAAFERPLFSFSLQPSGLAPLGFAKGRKPPLPGQPYALVCGVGAPQQVVATVTRFMGLPPHEPMFFADHHPYRMKDLEAIIRTAGDLPVICTAKDAVKLGSLALLIGLHNAPPDLWSLGTRATFGPALWADQPFPHWWENWWNNRPAVTA